MSMYIDLPSLILILLWTIPVLIVTGMLKDFVASFQRAFSRKKVCERADLQRSMEAVLLAEKANWLAGILGFLLAFVCICQQTAWMGREVFLANIAVAVITLIYAVVLNMLLLVVYGRLKKRYMNYMIEP